jgi:HAE1 family hydrophobic/amphiphilic exporter-1
MNLISAFVKRPVTTIMMVMAFVVLGAVSYTRLSVNRMPEMEYPLIQIVMVYEGAGPEELESQVVKKVEDQVSNISDIKKIISEVHEGYGWTLVEFELGADVDIKALEVKDKIEQIKRDFPDDADDPVVTKFDPLSTPVIKVALTSTMATGRDLFELSDKKLKDQFAQVSGVAKVEIVGGEKRQINVWAKLDKMDQYGLTVNDLVRAIKVESLDIPAGDIDRKTTEVGLRFKGEARTVEQIADLTFYARAHGIIKISDVARVEDGSEDVESLLRFNGRDAVLMSIYKRSDGNEISIANGIYKVLEEIRETLPKGTEITIAQDTSDSIRNSVNNALTSIVAGVILCSLLLYIFLRDIRITFVAAVVIPTSIISAFFLMKVVGFTLNVVTLLALGISIGTLVANAIVVLENITRKTEEGKSPQDAAVTGTKEIAVAVMASAGTNIVVFIPISFMSGMVGVFFNSFGITVVFATIFSLIASFSLTPMLSAVFFRGREKKKPNLFVRMIHAPLLLFDKFLNILQNQYGQVLRSILKHPFLTAIFAIIIFFASGYLLKYIGKEYFPSTDSAEINIRAQLTKGATAKEAARVISDIEAVVRDIPEIRSYTSNAGGENKGLDNVNVFIWLVNVEERERYYKEIMYDIQPALARIPGAEIYVRGAKLGSSKADVEIDVYGRDYEILEKIAERMRRIAMDTGNFRVMFNEHRKPKDEIRFYPDPYRRADYKIPNALIGSVLRNSVEGKADSVLRIEGEEYDIRVRLDEEYRNSIEDIKNYKVTTPKGPIPLSLLGTFEPAKGLTDIERRDKLRKISLIGFIAEKSLMENAVILEEKFKKIDFPTGYGYKFGGNIEKQRESSLSVLFVFLLAIILTYMLLAAILNSFSHPVTILATVPLALVGVFGTLFLSGIYLNMMSMMAIVMLVGIVVNNAILIVDYALDKVRNSEKTLEESVLEAGMVKFRAILMTNLAMLAGIAPQVTGGSGSEFMIPMAGTTMGGIAVSTLFTLFVIPALFVIVEKINQLSGRLLGSGTA